MNNPVCIRNTNLLYVYSQMDWRVRPLMTAIKAWAKSKGINEAVNQVWTINSILFCWLFVHKIIDLPRGQINNSSSGRILFAFVTVSNSLVSVSDP